MKKKWYRRGSVKAVLILVSYVAVVAAAFGGVALLRLADAGVQLRENGESFWESARFGEIVFDDGMGIMRGLKAEIVNDVLEKNREGAFADIGALAQSEDKSILESVYPAEGKETDLVYKMEDLYAWAKNREGYFSGYEEPILRCVKEDGSYHYYYCQEFIEGLRQGTILCDWEKEAEYYFGQDFWENDAYLSDYSDMELTDFITNAAYSGRNIGKVTDTAAAKNGTAQPVEYVKCYPEGEFNAGLLNGDTGIGEFFSPKGYGNLLGFLNENEEWNKKLEEVYYALDCALEETAAYINGNYQMVSSYDEGKTNIAYLYADLDEKKIYTNREIYRDFENLENSLKDMKGYSYLQIFSDSKSITNIDRMLEDNILGALEYHAADISNAKNYVFAMQVDTGFPIEDKLQDHNEIYTKYSGYLKPVLAGVIFAGVLWFIATVWLTVLAGRKPEDEEIHLNRFDGIYTEIAVGCVFVLWFLGMMFGINVGDALASWGTTEKFFNTVSALAAILIIFTQTLFLVVWLSLVRKAKARTLWKNSLCRQLCGWMGKILRGLYRWIGKLFNWFKGTVYGKDIVLDGLKRISEGELQYKIPLDKVNGKKKAMAEYINNIGDGLDAAVEKNMRSERMKTDLITNVSHDIKTPLTSIINYVDLLKRENFTDPKVQGYLQILDEKSQRLKILTEDVVEASKASSGNINLEMSDLDFVELIHQVLGEFEEKFREKNLTMMVHFGDEPSVIHADGQRMWRVLSNIFGNVVKYAMEGTRVYAEVQNKNKKVIFTLKNISAQPLNISADELTERFIRGDLSRNTEGSGLGLSIAKSLTQLQGGEFKLFVDGDLFKVMITFAAKEK